MSCIALSSLVGARHIVTALPDRKRIVAQLRNYGNPKQIGHEPTIEAYIEKLLAQGLDRPWFALVDDRRLLYLQQCILGTRQRYTHLPGQEHDGGQSGRANGYKPKDLILLSARIVLALHQDRPS